MLSRALLSSRNVMQTMVRRSHDHGGVPMGNMPFNCNNRFKFTVYFTLFCGSGFWIPFYAVQHQMTKQ